MKYIIKIKNNCRFRDKNIESDKIRDHCHLTGNYRGVAHSKCDINVTQKRSSFIPFLFITSLITIVTCSSKK